MDGLDIPIVAAFDAQFAEGYPDERQPATRPVGDSLARYGSGWNRCARRRRGIRATA